MFLSKFWSSLRQKKKKEVKCCLLIGTGLSFTCEPALHQRQHHLPEQPVFCLRGSLQTIQPSLSNYSIIFNSIKGLTKCINSGRQQCLLLRASVISFVTFMTAVVWGLILFFFLFFICSLTGLPPFNSRLTNAVFQSLGILFVDRARLQM